MLPRFYAPVADCGVVWYELCEYAGIAMGVWVSVCNCRERDCGTGLPLVHENKEILVKKSAAEFPQPISIDRAESSGGETQRLTPMRVSP